MLLYTWLFGLPYSLQERAEKTSEILSAKGASMMIRKDLFEKLGGFDEKFFATFEDLDLGWRTWISGYKVVVVTKSVVYHIGDETVNKMMSEISFHGFKNQLSMKITNLGNQCDKMLGHVFCNIWYQGTANFV